MIRASYLVIILLTIPSLSSAQGASPVWPAHDAVVPDSVVDFVWNGSYGVSITYHLQIASDSLFTNPLLDQSALSANTYSAAGLTMGQTYWWRVQKIDNGVPSGWSSSFRFKIFSPLAVPEIIVWLEPEAGLTQSGSQVQSWQSRVGSYTLSQATGTRMPYLTDTFLFGRQGIWFDGIDDFLQGPFLNHQEMTIVVMHHPRNKNSTLFSQARFTFTGFNWHINNASRPSLGCVQTPANASFTFNGLPYPFTIPSKTFSVDGLAISNQGIRLFTGMADTATTQTVSFLDIPAITLSRLGALGNNSAWYDGVVYEVIIADTILSKAIYEDIYNYLLWKYQPPVNLGPDIHITYSFCETVLKPSHNYRSYLWSTGDTTAAIATNIPGSYWLQATDFMGRVSSDTVNIFSHLPAVAMADTTICLNVSVTLNTGITGLYTFEWNNDPLLNQPVYTTSAAGMHTVIISDSFNCQITDTVFITIDSYALTTSLGPDRSVCIGEPLSLASGAAQTVSYQWSTGIFDTLPQVTVLSGGSYYVTTTNSSGCSAVSQVNLTVKGVAPTAAFSLSAKTICNKTPLVLINQSSATLPLDPLSSWQWDFGDGNGAFTSNATHIFQQPGVYTIGMTVITDSGCFAQAFDTVNVLPLPGINISHNAPCTGVPVSFSNHPSGPAPVSHLWYFFSGTISKDSSVVQAPEYTWQTPGTYKVELIVVSLQGCVNRDSVLVQVNQSPAAALSYKPTPACNGDAVTFSDTSMSDPNFPVNQWLWNFGDGSPTVQGLKSPKHTFPGAGIFPVILTVGNNNSGCTDTVTVNIKIGETPQVIISGPLTFCSLQPDTLKEASVVMNDSIVEWRWETGPHGSLYSQNPVLAFPDSGKYLVTLTVTTSHGCRNTDTNTAQVYKTPDTKFSMSKAFGNPPLTVEFHNQTTGAGAYSWDFGDGQVSSLQSPFHTFSQKGIFTVQLHALSDDGCAGTHSDIVYTIQPYIDIEMVRIEAVIKEEGQLKIIAEFKNNSIFDLQRVDVIAWIVGGSPVVESWVANDFSDRLKPGNIKRYEFSSGFFLSEEIRAERNIVCARACLPEFSIDSNPDNDEKCVPFNNKFVINDPYPNPARDLLRLDIIVDIPDIITMSICNLQGQTLSLIYEEYLEAGLNTFRIPLPDNLTQGVYFLKLNYRDQVINKKVVIIK